MGCESQLAAQLCKHLLRWPKHSKPGPLFRSVITFHQ